MRWRKALLAALTFLVALELVLQVGALAMAWFIPSRAAAGGAAVLCVGDSFTFGIGARSPATSYPGQLAGALATRGLPGVVVSNAGFPGHHSGDVLRKLAGQITASTKVVCVLVGTNDSWRHPSRVEAAELAQGGAGSGFEWRWRTWGLVQLLGNFESGSWQQAGETKVAGNAAVQPGDDRELGFAELARYGISIGKARLGRYEPDRTLPMERNDAFRQCMQAGDFAQACAQAEQSVREHPESPLALQQVVTAAVQVGQRDKAMAAVSQLAQLVKAKPSGAAAECLVDAYLTSGQSEQAIAAARQRIAQQPLSIVAWDSLQQAAFVLGRRDDALQAMPEVLRLMGRTDPIRSGFIARHLARWWMENEPQRAAGLLFAAFLIDGNVEEARIAGMVAAPIMRREHFDRVLAGLSGASPAACRAFAAVLDEVYAEKDAESWGAVLRDHLNAIREVARQRGVQLVILSYPFHQPLVEQRQREVAQSLGVPFVAIRERFDVQLRTRTTQELFVADGHCSDAGYKLMAEMVAQAIAPLLAR
jgi:lysophospholipase L1-like esterase